jgi:alpha-beta hydrolase superfamily lysophospholipase
VAVNVVAWRHAHAMTHFTGPGNRSQSPEELSAAQKIATLLAGVKVSRPENRSTPIETGLDYETVSFTGAHNLSIEAWLIEAPASKGTILLFHGYASAKDSLIPTARAFHDLGYTTMLIDFHGSGGSGGGSTSIGYHEADDVVAAAAYARTRFPSEPLILHGTSLGAVAVLRAVGPLGLEADAIIAEAPYDRMLTTVQRRFSAMKAPSFPAAQLLAFWGGRQHGFNAFDHNPMDYAREIDCPTLILLGDQDPRVRVEDGTRVHENLSGGRKLEIFEGAGHGACLKTDPKKWNDVVAELLSRAESNSSRQR